ncbi:hypothetical protein ACFL1Q_01430 [Patescibacteria group bacterium]
MIKIALFVINVLTPILIVVLLALSIRGSFGSPTSNDLSSSIWRGEGVFELSPERGRFALTYSLIEDKSFYFSVDLARFIIPDLGYKDGHYVSLFAPAVSFMVMPGYLIGKYLGASQVGAFAVIGIFALINLILIKEIVKSLGGNKIAGWISGLIFLFATSAYSYAVNLYQHQISTFLILLSSLILIRTKKIWPLFFVWFFCAMSITVDYPNLFLMFPIGLFGVSKLLKIQQKNKKKVYKVNVINLLTVLGVVLPILFFGWFNYKSYSNPLQFSGTVGGVHEIDENGNPTASKTIDPQDVERFVNPDEQKKSALAWFNPRESLNGLYILMISPDRGVVVFAPIIVLGLVGMFVLGKKKNKYLPMLLGVIVVNITLYSMWGDPWGGWAFGSRYLIPAYAIMSVFIGVALTEFRRKWLFLVVFYPVLVYSILVNTLGALTTSANPPKTEALPLEAISGRRERYSYDRNWEFLISGKSKSFVFQTWGYKYLDSVYYYYLISGLIILLTTTNFVWLIIQKNEKAIKQN